MRLFIALERRSINCGQIKLRHLTNIGAMVLTMELKVRSSILKLGSFTSHVFMVALHPAGLRAVT